MKVESGFKVKKFQSTPSDGSDMRRGFQVKKALTMDSSPIVLIEPPKEKTN